MSQKIDCTKNCKMTKELRNSKFCNGEAKIINSKIVYGCQEALKKEPKEVKQFYSCDLWDMQIKEACNTCMLQCINNNGELAEKAAKERAKLEKVIQDLKPQMMLYGISANEVERISEKYTQDTENGTNKKLGSEAINAANFANNALKAILAGKPIDLAFFSLYAKKTSRKIKSLKKKS